MNEYSAFTDYKIFVMPLCDGLSTNDEYMVMEMPRIVIRRFTRHMRKYRFSGLNSSI